MLHRATEKVRLLVGKANCDSFTITSLSRQIDAILRCKHAAEALSFCFFSPQLDRAEQVVSVMDRKPPEYRCNGTTKRASVERQRHVLLHAYSSGGITLQDGHPMQTQAVARLVCREIEPEAGLLAPPDRP